MPRSVSTCSEFGGTEDCAPHLTIPGAEPGVWHPPGVVCRHSLSGGARRPARRRARPLGLSASLRTWSSQAERRGQCARGAGGRMGASRNNNGSPSPPVHCAQAPGSSRTDPRGGAGVCLVRTHKTTVFYGSVRCSSRESPRRRLPFSSPLFQLGRPRQRGAKSLAHGCPAGEQRLRLQPGRRSWLKALPAHPRAARTSG